ncbi:MAG: hypothetical protein E6J29_10750 [Chloroflexi bacterium]|nr:MAG: hypothetical protein E6J29_10750 [Chloroflexota bacterium]
MALDPVRTTAIASLSLAAVALAAFPLLSLPVGAGLATGLVLGALNPILARRLLGNGLPYHASSLMRLLTVSALAVGAGILLGAPWAPLAGLVAVQVVLMAASTAAYLRQRQ